MKCLVPAVIKRRTLFRIALVGFCCWCAPLAASAAFSPLPKSGGVTVTNTILLVTPGSIDFGVVAPGKTATNTFLIENAGRGTLTGKATVPAPFKIISGAKYALKEKEVQVVTVVYSPSRKDIDEAVVTFTGSSTAKAKVSGQRAGTQAPPGS